MLDKIASLFMFAGGLGMFLYGMHIMAEGMQKAAGNKMKDFLGMLTGNRFLAVGIGLRRSFARREERLRARTEGRVADVFSRTSYSGSSRSVARATMPRVPSEPIMRFRRL